MPISYGRECYLGSWTVDCVYIICCRCISWINMMLNRSYHHVDLLHDVPFELGNYIFSKICSKLWVKRCSIHLNVNYLVHKNFIKLIHTFKPYFHFNLNVHNWSDIWQFLSEQNVVCGWFGVNTPSQSCDNSFII